MGQFLFLLMVVLYVQQVYVTNILPDRVAKDTFQQASCLLMGKKLSTKGHLIQRYRADFLISYNANGVQYNRWVSGNGLDRGYSKNQTDQEDLLTQFEVGSLYACWFDPSMAQYVILIMRRNWYSALPAVLPALFGLWVFYYFSKTLFGVVDGMMMRSRKKRKVTHLH